ncbi:MAG TPA: hypothetical protein VFA38_02680 [Nitrospirales bacterium]|nr:hypothetical protein [Nitrospirales bacterium]
MPTVRPTHWWLAALWLMLTVAVGIAAAADSGDASRIAPGGATTPPGGGRLDETQPQLGSGNRGSGLRGSSGASSVDPSHVRKDPAAAGRITGDVLSIDGGTYIVRDEQGNELALHTDKRTLFSGVVRIGEHIVADIEPGGRVATIRQGP